MNKLEWYKSSTALREVLKRLRDPRDRSEYTKYKFGLCFDYQRNYFVIWNGRSRNIVATIKIGEQRAVVRYRKTSFYRYILQGLLIPDREMIFIESNNLGRHRAFPRQRLQGRINENLEAESRYSEQVVNDFRDGTMTAEEYRDTMRSRISFTQEYDEQVEIAEAPTQDFFVDTTISTLEIDREYMNDMARRAYEETRRSLSDPVWVIEETEESVSYRSPDFYTLNRANPYGMLTSDSENDPNVGS